jgi:hypothetical protein
MQWNKVTWYSRYLAMILFVALPFLGFYLGIRYEWLSQKAAQLQTTADSLGGWRTYHDESHGVTLSYPSSWQLMESSPGNVSVSDGVSHISLRASPKNAYLSYLSCPILTHVVSCTKMENPNGVPYIREVSTGQLQFSKQQQIDAFWQSSTADMQMTLILTNANGQSLGQVNTAKDVFETIVNSIKAS